MAWRKSQRELTPIVLGVDVGTRFIKAAAYDARTGRELEIRLTSDGSDLNSTIMFSRQATKLTQYLLGPVRSV
jgi:hypothetical protein